MVIQTYLQLLVVILQNVGRRQQRAQRTISTLMEFNSRGRSFLFCWADISMAHFDSLDERVTRNRIARGRIMRIQIDTWLKGRST